MQQTHLKDYILKFYKKYIKHLLFLIIFLLINSCYSFTGGTIPSHLKTLKIEPVIDNSNFGNPEYKIELERNLISKFQNDNSFELAEGNNGNAKITVTITSINETTQTIGTNELETERKITLNATTKYYDNINNKQIWEKTYSSYQLFDIRNVTTAREEAIKTILLQLSEDIMLAVVSGW